LRKLKNRPVHRKKTRHKILPLHKQAPHAPRLAVLVQTSRRQFHVKKTKNKQHAAVPAMIVVVQAS